MSRVLSALDNQSNLCLYIDDQLKEKESSSIYLIFLIEGEMNLQVEQDYYRMQPNDVIVVNKYKKIELKKSTDENLFLLFEISDNLLLQATEVESVKFNCNSINAIDNQHYSDLRERLHKIVEIYVLKERRANFLLFSYVYQLLNNLISNFSVETESIKKSSIRVRKIIQYILDHYNEDLTLQILGKEFYLEPTYFSKFFKKNIGVNFKEYIINLRLGFAEKDLIKTEKNIAKVAIDNGFSSVNSFNRAFKEAYQVTPSEYREKNEAVEVMFSVETHDKVAKRYNKYKVSPLQDSSEKNESIIIHTKDVKGTVNPVWSQLINMGEAKDLLSDSMKKHIIQLKEEINYRYIRMWGIFNSDLYTDWSCFTILNYEKLDEIFDFLLKNDVLPWIELNKGNREGILTEIKLSNWIKLCKDFFEHMMNRYGLREVKKWKFELTLHDLHDVEEVKKYPQLFISTQKIIKKISPEIQLGGGCFKVETNNQRLEDIFKELCYLDFDFYSFMLYPYVQKKLKEERNSQRITDKNYLLNRVRYINKLLKPYPSKAVYITEWNNSVSNKNMINDTLYKGAYIVKNIMDILGEIEGIGYAVASDLFHSNQSTTKILNGGSGLLNKFGMKKPAMFAMKFFTELENFKIISKLKNVLACKVDNNEIILFCHNYKHPNQLYYLKNESEILPSEINSFFTDEKEQLNLKLKSMDNGQYEIRTFVCNRLNGSLFDIWRDFDFLEELRPSDLHYIKKKNYIHMKLEEVVIERKEINIKRQIEPNEFFTIHIRNKTRIR